MNILPIALYRVICYASLVLAFLYLPVFLLELEGVINRVGAPGVSVLTAIVVDLALVVLVGISWRVTARGALKRCLGRYMTRATLRSTCILQLSLSFLATMVFWQPLPQLIWSLHGWAMVGTYGLFVLGLVTTIGSVILVDRRVSSGATHPVQLGLGLLLLSSPQMTGGQLLLAVATILFMVRRP